MILPILKRSLLFESNKCGFLFFLPKNALKQHVGVDDIIFGDFSRKMMYTHSKFHLCIEKGLYILLLLFLLNLGDQTAMLVSSFF